MTKLLQTKILLKIIQFKDYYQLNLSVTIIHTLMIQQQLNEQSLTSSAKSYVLSSASPYIVYAPQPKINSDKWCHPVLGYPMCPLIGRYNNGEYLIGEVVLHLEFICSYNKEIQNYQCGTRQLRVPKFLVHSLRNIPEVIQYNKPKDIKNQPNAHLFHHQPEKTIKLNFIISFGQLAKDFLNYINHCYVFDESVFDGNKFHRTTSNIPIVAYLPKGSNIDEEEAIRGISLNEWRSQYLSIHLKGGAPAFSPNNMRLLMKNPKKMAYSSNQHFEEKGGFTNKKKKYKLKQENQNQQQKTNSEVQKKHQQEVNDNISNQYNNIGAFIHFYTAVLLPHDHRINYHWHIEEKSIQSTIKQLLSSVGSVEEFIKMYRKMKGLNSMIQELSSLLIIQ